MRKFGFDAFFAPGARALEQDVPDHVADALTVDLPHQATSHAFGRNKETESGDIDHAEDDHVCDENCGCVHDAHDHNHDDHYFDHTAMWLEPAEDELFLQADGKPSHAGGGGGGGGDGGGKGRGNSKDKPVEEPTGETDPAPQPEPTPEPEPAPAPEPTPEPAPAGFGWIDGSTYLSGAETPDGFNIELKFHGEWTDFQKSVAVAQAELLSENITGDMLGANGIDDLRINMYSVSLDGAGGTWGKGGVVQARADGTVLEGRVRLDTADLGTAESWGMMDELMLHEMLHAMGFGTTWNQSGLTSGSSFIGETAMDVFGGPVPLDSSGAHLLNSGATKAEIGSTNFQNGETISDLTLAILEDMGYETIYPDEPEEIAALVV